MAVVQVKWQAPKGRSRPYCRPRLQGTFLCHHLFRFLTPMWASPVLREPDPTPTVSLHHHRGSQPARQTCARAFPLLAQWPSQHATTWPTG